MSTWRGRLVGYDVSGYIVDDVLVDVGPWRSRHDMLNAVQNRRIRGAIVTHWHEDHAGNAPAFLRQGIPMWMAPETEAALRAPFSPKFYRRFTWGRSPRLAGTVERFDLSPLEVLHLPGHSSDHHCVWDPRTRTLFSADLWLGVRVRAIALSENPYTHAESLERAIALNPARMFDAHRGLIDNPVDMLRAKLTWLRETVHAVEERIRRGDSDRVILAEVLGGEESIGRLSQGEYARINFVRVVRAICSPL